MKKIIMMLCVVIVLGVIIVPIAASGGLNISTNESGISAREGIANVASVSSTDGENIRLTYERSRAVSEGYADIYKDAKGNDYIYKNGKLTGFYSNEIKRPVTDCTPVGQTAAVAAAVDFLAPFTDNAEEYVLQTFEAKESYGQY